MRRSGTRRASRRTAILLSLSSVLALVQSQQELAGRKTIISLSSMRQINEAAKQAIESIVGSANQAGVGINVVDGASLSHRGSRMMVPP